MSLETQLTDPERAILAVLDSHGLGGWALPACGEILSALRALAHDGVLVVDFRTDSSGEVMRAEKIAAHNERRHHVHVVCNATDAHRDCEPLFALVRPNDGSDNHG